MSSIIRADTIQDLSGNNIINESDNTITIGASGDTTNIVGTLQNNGSAVGGGDNDPMFSAKFTGSQSITSSSQVKITAFSSEQYDYDSAYDGNRFTVPAGITNQPFFFQGNVVLASVDDGKRVELTFRVNGSSVQNTRTYAATGSANTGTDLTYSQQLSTGDYVEVYVYHNSSGSKDIVDGFFAVHKLIKG